MPKLLNIDLLLKNILILIFLQFGFSFAYGMDPDEGGGESSGTVGSAVLEEAVTAPPSERVSPICQSPVPSDPTLPRGCVDPRVYTSNFGEQADIWHREKSELLMHICEEIGRNRDQRNLAFAGVRLIYKLGGEESEFKSTPIIDLDPIFTSGSESYIIKLPNPQGGRGHVKSNTININSQHLIIESIRDQFPPAVEKNQIISSLSQKLNSLLPEHRGQTTKLCALFLDGWREKIDYGTENFEEDFLHSEQALRLYLIKNVQDICTRLLAHIPESSTVYQLVIHIVSVNEMCQNCATTWFLSSEGGDLKRVFHDQIKNTHPYTIFEDTLSILTQVSGLKIFQRPQRPHLEKQISNQANASALNFPPHIAQHLLGEELSYWNVELLGVYSPRKGQGYNPNRPQKYVNSYY